MVEFIGLEIEEWRKNYNEVYLVRNERQLKIYNYKDGRAFEPDFLLYLQKKSGKKLIYQIFIEPKGEHLREHDKWKEDFLKEITKKNEETIWKINEKDKYKVLGVPFFSKVDEEEFREDLESVIKK